IDGDTIDPAWDGAQPVVLDELEIVWGRHGLLEDIAPSRARLRILDRTGEFVTDDALIGRSLVVTATVNAARTRFRGRISGAEVAPARVRNPLTGHIETVWIGTLDASDVLTDLAQARVPGPGAAGDAGDFTDLFGEGYWPITGVSTRRRDHIMDAGANRYITSLATSSA